MTKPGRRIVHCNDEARDGPVAFGLGSEKSVWRGQVSADRGNLHKTAHAGLLACRDQRHHGAPVDGVEAVPRTVLQGACCIHDRIHTRNHPQPVFGGKQSRHVGRDPADRRPASLRIQNIATKAGHMMTVAEQTADDGLPDQTIAAENKNLHVALLSGGFQRSLHRGDRIFGLGGIGAAGLGHVRPAAAALPAQCGRCHAHQIDGAEAAGKVVGDRRPRRSPRRPRRRRQRRRRRNRATSCRHRPAASDPSAKRRKPPLPRKPTPATVSFSAGAGLPRRRPAPVSCARLGHSFSSLLALVDQRLDALPARRPAKSSASRRPPSAACPVRRDVFARLLR